jgi:signal transduction histidine kinase
VTTPRSVTRSLPGEAARWVGQFGNRLREPAFWAIQAMVLGITALHIGLEAAGVSVGPVGLSLGLHHFPVLLYLFPIVYAGLRYGYEGSLLTGAWCLLLTLPNVLWWHLHDYTWAGELAYVGVIVAIGIVVAVPVERERRQQHRLAFVSEVAASLASPATLERNLSTLPERLIGLLSLRAAGAAWLDERGRGLAVRISGDIPADLAEAAARSVVEGTEVDGEVLGFAVRAGDEPAGALLAVPLPGRVLGGEEISLLRAVADQIGVGLENTRLHRQERERLRSYVHDVTRAQEEEHKRLARELHDTAAQDLVLLARKLETLAGEVQTEALDELRALASGTLEEIRHLSRDLRPTVLDDLGLVPALQWLAAEATARGLPTACSVTGQAQRLDAELELVLFRITQEALRNTEKHAGARAASVFADFAEGGVRLTVSDDGAGFAPPAVGELAGSGKLGLVGMHERAELVGGRLELSSRPGRGTTVCVHAPTGSGPQP